MAYTKEQQRIYTRDYTRRRREQDPEYRDRILAANRKWAAQNRSRVTQMTKEWLALHPEREKQYQANYAATGARLKRQEAKVGRPKPQACEICERPSRRICYDHCHQTGRSRGWLCDKCNFALGLLDDDPALLRKLAAYLERD